MYDSIAAEAAFAEAESYERLLKISMPPFIAFDKQNDQQLNVASE